MAVICIALAELYDSQISFDKPPPASNTLPFNDNRILGFMVLPRIQLHHLLRESLFLICSTSRNRSLDAVDQWHPRSGRHWKNENEVKDF